MITLHRAEPASSHLFQQHQSVCDYLIICKAFIFISAQLILFPWSSKHWFNTMTSNSSYSKSIAFSTVAFFPGQMTSEQMTVQDVMRYIHMKVISWNYLSFLTKRWKTSLSGVVVPNKMESPNLYPQDFTVILGVSFIQMQRQETLKKLLDQR